MGALFSGKNSLERCTHKSGASKNMGALFSWKTNKCLEQRTHKIRASKNMGPFLSEKNSLEQRTHKLGASKNMGPVCLNKKKAYGNVVRHVGLPNIWGPLFWNKKKKRLRQRSQTCRASQNMEAIIWRNKKRLRQRSQKCGASKNIGGCFSGPAAT